METQTLETAKQEARGEAFALWLREAIKRSGLSTNAVGQKLSVTSQYLYALLNNRQTGNGKFRRPTESLVREIAAATGADVAAGLEAAGHELAARESRMAQSAVQSFLGT